MMLAMMMVMMVTMRVVMMQEKDASCSGIFVRLTGSASASF